MAQPTTARPGKMRILLWDVDKTPAPGFSAPCGLTAKGATVTKNLAEIAIPDCDDPDAPLWMGRDVETMSMSISGEGVMAAESEDLWNEAAFTTDSIQGKVEIEFDTGTRTFAGDWHVRLVCHQRAAGPAGERQRYRCRGTASLLSSFAAAP